MRLTRVRLSSLLVPLLLFAALSTSVGAQSPDDLIVGDVPSEGVALLVTREAATPGELVSALATRGCVTTTIAVTEGGEWVTFVPTAPDFVNAGFEGALDGGVLPAGHPFAVRCADRGAAGFVLDEAHGLGSGGFAMQTDVRAASHPGYDRIVFEFDEDVIPVYDIEYVTETQYTCGQGAPVALEGGAVLRVRFTNARINDDAGNLTIPSRTLDAGLPQLDEAREICAFEGQVTWLLAVDAERPFRLLVMQDPGRIAIDFPHADCEECAAPGGRGGLAGVVFAGPQCPVVQEGENCPDRLADIAFEVDRAGQTVANVDPGADGQFQVSLDAGAHRINFPTDGFPFGGTTDVTVPTGGFLWIELRVDTGIR